MRRFIQEFVRVYRDDDEPLARESFRHLRRYCNENNARVSHVLNVLRVIVTGSFRGPKPLTETFHDLGKDRVIKLLEETL